MCAVLLVGAAGALAPAATAGGRRFPVPSCGWVPAAQISETVGEPVRALKPVWTTDIAPVLSCQYRERVPKLQLKGDVLFDVQFREQQLLQPPTGAVSVGGLGSCIAGRTCPKAGHPAWLFELAGRGIVGASPYAVKFTQLTALEVEDGFNQLTLVVQNPQGPLPVTDEVRALEQLARRLLPRFYWN
jgi:hypothetical protein